MQPKAILKVIFKKIDKYKKSKKDDLERKILWDKLQKKMSELNMSTQEQEKIKNEIIHKDSEILRTKYLFK